MNLLRLPSPTVPRFPFWRHGLGRAARGLRRFTIASLLVTGACGGLATSSTSGPLGSGSDPGFLAPCEQSCGGGSECIGGLCSRRCEGDTECLDLSSGASCRQDVASGGGQPRCEVECATDEGCVNALGEGYHCEGAFCRAGSSASAGDAWLGTLPAEFKILELGRSEPGPSLCPRVMHERSKLNRELNMLIWSSCDAASGVSLSGDLVLDPNEVEQVRNAYANVRTASKGECTTDVPVLTLDISGDDGVSGGYVDAGSAGCPEGRYRGSVTGLQRLRDVLLDLRGAH